MLSRTLAVLSRTLAVLSRTLAVLSVAFVVLTAPVSVNQLLLDFQDESALASMRAPEIFRHLFYKTVFNLVYYTNSAVNIFLYVLTGRNFRTRLLALLRKVAVRPVLHPGGDQVKAQVT